MNPPPAARHGTMRGLAKPVPRLIQGGARMGAANRDRTFRLLDELFALGCNAVETARTYGNGTSEAVLGEWMKSRGVRERVVVLTKGGKTADHKPRLDARGIREDLEASLEALGTDHVDVWMTHRDDESVEPGEVVEILEGHRRAGLIRAYGASNWSYERVRAANNFAARTGRAGLSCSSPQFSLAEPYAIPWEGCRSVGGAHGRAARAWYAATKLPVVFWSSLAGGFFSGLLARDNLGSFTGYWEKVCADTYGREPNFAKLERARELAAARGATLPQVALAYVLNQPMNAFCLTTAASAAEMRENLGALDLALTPAELNWLESGGAGRPEGV